MSTTITGNLKKMRVSHADPVEYTLVAGEQSVPLNDFIGGPFSLKYLGEIHCVNCGRKTKKSFNQGYCFPCLRKLAECDGCIIRPETCHFHEGTCREPDWGRKHCLQSHIVYFANTSGLKVGITRASQVPTRWIDQGATVALPVVEVTERLHSGLLETAIKKHMHDKTDWRRMLRGEPDPIDLIARRDELRDELETEIAKLPGTEVSDAGTATILNEDTTFDFNYPVQQYPEKVKSITLDKVPEVTGELQGIKGQYLIFDIGVMNIRRHGGYVVELKV